MTTWFLKDTVFKTIDRLCEVTDYPYKLIVGDNLSENSESIREKLKEYVDAGKIDKLYLFDGNYRGGNVIEIFKKEKLGKYTILTDSDAYILEKDEPCWLTTFVNKLDSDNTVGSIAFSSINSPTKITARGADKSQRVKKVKELKNKTFCKKDSVDGKCHHNGHFLTLRTSILKKKLVKAGGSGDAFVDGNLYGFIKSLGYSLLRYDKTSVLNLSTISSLNLSEKYGVNISYNKKYLKLRKESKHYTSVITEENYTTYENV